MMKLFASLLIIGALANSAKVPANADTTRVEVKGPRVHAKDVFPGTVADIDLGPTPPIGATRMKMTEKTIVLMSGMNTAQPRPMIVCL